MKERVPVLVRVVARLRTLRMLLGMAWRVDRATTAIVLALIVGQSIADGLVSLSLRWILDAAIAGEGGRALAAAAAGGLALGLAHAGGRVRTNLQTDLTEHAGVLLSREVLRLSSALDGLEHLERPTYLDRLTIVREKSAALAEFGWSALGLVSLAVRLLVSLWLLVTVDPLLLVLALLFVVSILFARAGQRRVTRALDATATMSRREEHLFDLCTKPGPGKEIRIYRSGPELDRRSTRLWREITGIQVRARMFAAFAALVGGLMYALGFAGLLLLVVSMALRGQATAGDIVLLVNVANQLRNQAGSMVGVVGAFIEGLHVLDHYRWLRDYAAAGGPRGAGAPVPRRLHNGIDIDAVWFRYPETDRDVLRDVTLHLPAGGVVALVGEHGAGKTTLVKLLCAFYQPTCGAIGLDQVPLADIPAARWREHTSAAFQDFSRFQFLARETVGVGDLPYLDDPPRIMRAMRRAHATDTLASLPDGLESQLGRVFPGGVELSEGQWQKLALSRAFMRDAPLLMILDEPTASLDARTEQELFERYAAHARRLGREVGAITVLVSHRFSTVRMADHIVVLDGGRVVQQGTHESLIDSGGLYADLYRLQAAAYE